MTLPEQLKAWRRVDASNNNRGEFTQAEAAAVLGVPHKTFLDWEQGRRTPRGLALRMIQQIISQPLRAKEYRPARSGESNQTTTGTPAATGGGETKEHQHEKKSRSDRTRRVHPSAARKKSAARTSAAEDS